RSAYADYSQIAGLEFSLRDHDTALNSAEANKYVSSTLLRRRFLARAEDEGIVFSEQVDRTAAQSKLLFFPLLRFTRLRALIVTAAAVLLIVSISLVSYRLGRGIPRPTPIATAARQPTMAGAPITNTDDQGLKESFARQAQLQLQVSLLQARLKAA